MYFGKILPKSERWQSLQIVSALWLGSKSVAYMKEKAKQLGIRRLFTFTLTEDFIKMLGITRPNQAELPPKVWGECSRCPKYFQCDEVGMAQDL